MISKIISSFKNLAERRRRRRCHSWICPRCGRAFGSHLGRKEWRRKPGSTYKGNLISGPVLHCTVCNQDFWFTWKGADIPALLDTFEVVDRKL